VGNGTIAAKRPQQHIVINLKNSAQNLLVDFYRKPIVTVCFQQLKLTEFGSTVNQRVSTFCSMMSKNAEECF